jgi:hypothetical protein
MEATAIVETPCDCIDGLIGIDPDTNGAIFCLICVRGIGQELDRLADAMMREASSLDWIDSHGGGNRFLQEWRKDAQTAYDAIKAEWDRLDKIRISLLEPVLVA